MELWAWPHGVGGLGPVVLRSAPLGAESPRIRRGHCPGLSRGYNHSLVWLCSTCQLQNLTP